MEKKIENEMETGIISAIIGIFAIAVVSCKGIAPVINAYS